MIGLVARVKDQAIAAVLDIAEAAQAVIFHVEQPIGIVERVLAPGRRDWLDAQKCQKGIWRERGVQMKRRPGRRLPSVIGGPGFDFTDGASPAAARAGGAVQPHLDQVQHAPINELYWPKFGYYAVRY